MVGFPPERRKFQRHKTRIPCKLRANGEEHSGLVTDVAAHGLFVQTQARLEGGAAVLILLQSGHTTLTLTGSVSRTRRAHRDAVCVRSPGTGIELASAPEEFFQLVADLEACR
jgi:hypothetical protein